MLWSNYKEIQKKKKKHALHITISLRKANGKQKQKKKKNGKRMVFHSKHYFGCEKLVAQKIN